jgi:hypothetical protein
MADTITELGQAWPSNVAAPSLSAGSSATTETPLGSTKGNFFGKEKAPLQARAAATQAIQEAVEEEGRNAVARAKIGEDQAHEQKATTDANMSAMQTLQDAHNAETNRLIEEHRPIIDAADKFKFHDYWSDGHTGNAALAAISSALLGFGTGQYHNVAMEIAKNDGERQVNEFNGLMERARLAGADEDRLAKIQERGWTNMGIMQAAKYNAVARKYDELAAQATTVEAQTTAKMNASLARKKAADEMEDVYKGLRTRSARNVSQSIAKPKATALPGF